MTVKDKKPKKRWLTANQIRDAIDEYKKKAGECVLRAEVLEKTAKMFDESGMTVDRDFNERMAAKERTRAARIYDKKLPYLKQKLAEWQTELLPGVISDGDRSVQA